MFCTKLSAAYRKLLKALDEEIQDDLPKIKDIVSHLKAGIDSSLVRELVDITPSTWDNNMRNRWSSYLDTALRQFSMVQQYLNADGTINMSRVLLELSKLLPTDRDMYYQKISALLLKYAHGAKYPQSVYDFYSQGDYTVKRIEAGQVSLA